VKVDPDRDAELRANLGFSPPGAPTFHDRIEEAISSKRCPDLTRIWRFTFPARDAQCADQLRYRLVYQLVRHVALDITDTVRAVQLWNDQFADQISQRRVDCPGHAYTPDELRERVAVEHAKALAQKERGDESLEHGVHDTQNADRLIELHGDDIRYVVQEQSWRVWDGRAWSLDDRGSTAVIARTVDVGRELEGLVAGLVDQQVKKELERRIRTALSARGRSDMARLARSDDRVRVGYEVFDRDPDLLAVGNCTVNLRTGETWEHRREDMLTCCLPIAYNPTAVGQAWDLFIAEALPDSAVRRYVQKVFGYAATGHVSERKLFVLLGMLGREGKSTIIGSVSKALGAYAIPAPAELLLRGLHRGLDEKKAKLRGVRLAHGSDLSSDSSQWDGQLVKELTGGDEITARDVYRARIRFRPTHVFVVAANKFPAVQSTDADTAFWDRIVVVPFEHRAEHLNLGLAAELELEAERILAWIVEGARAWHEEGLEPPPPVVEATRDARMKSDPLLQFLGKHLAAVPGNRLRASALWEAYVSARTPGGYGAKTFRDAVKARGYAQKSDGEGRYWVDVDLVPGGPGTPSGGIEGSGQSRITCARAHAEERCPHPQMPQQMPEAGPGAGVADA